MKFIAIIPARLDSKRLPRKVLREVLDKPLIQWVYERVARAGKLDAVWISTDSEEVEAACRKFTDNVHRSSSEHLCGTDRIAELAETLDADVYFNIQCDEPLMEPELVDAVADLFGAPDVQMATAATAIKTDDEMLDANVVKVVNDQKGDALYFSRAAIPWSRDEPPQAGRPLPTDVVALRHIGVYAYTRDCLRQLAALPRSPLEKIESLEQLRAQEHGWKIRVLEWDYGGIDVDTEEDLAQMRKILEREERS